MSASLEETIIPDGAILEYIEDRYGPLKDAIPCGIASCREPHKHGFIVVFRYPDNDNGLEQRGCLGHICGKNAFGASWKEAERSFNIKIRTTEIEAAAEGFQAKAETILPELRVAIPKLNWLRQARLALSRNLPWLMRLCIDGVRTKNGFLVRERRGEVTPVLKIEGASFFVSDPTYDKARELLLDIENMQRYLGHESASVREVERRLEVIGDVKRRWETIERWLQAGNKALHPANMRRIIEVVNKILGHEDIRMNGTIIEYQTLSYTSFTSDIWITILDVAEDVSCSL